MSLTRPKPPKTTTIFGGETNARIPATPSGSPGPFTYAWNTGATTQTLNNLAAGAYTVTVTNTAGCTATAASTVTQPMTLNINIPGTILFCGNKNNGLLTENVPFGTAPFTFVW